MLPPVLRLAFTLVVALPALAPAAPVVLLFPAVGTTSQVTLSGRVLKNGPGAGSSSLSKNLRRLTTSNWEGAEVDVRFQGQQAVVKSGHDGNFEATFTAGKAPFPTGLWTAEAGVKGAEPGRATVDVMAPGAPFFVISDFDDTLAVSNVLERGKFVENVLVKDELSQPVVEGMAAFYGCLRDKPDKPVFALVSGSPVQYVARVSRFLQKHDFPVFGLYLRDLGPSTLSDYKQPIIRALFKSVPGPVVLVGDSGEKDPEVYAQMRAEFPDRVKAIFIRDAGRTDDASRFEGMTLFKHPREAALAAATQGLLEPKCARRIAPEDGGTP
jgi:phosphatidate phosphatase APP1